MEVGRHFPHTFGLGFPPPLSNSSFPPPPFGFLPLSRGSFAKGVDCKVKHRGKGKVLIYALKLPRIFHSVQPAPTRYGDRNHCPPLHQDPGYATGQITSSRYVMWSKTNRQTGRRTDTHAWTSMNKASATDWVIESFSTRVPPYNLKKNKTTCNATSWRLSDVTVGYRTCDQEVVSSTPGRVAIKWLVLGWVTVCAHRTGKPSQYKTNSKVNSAFHHYRDR